MARGTLLVQVLGSRTLIPVSVSAPTGLRYWDLLPLAAAIVTTEGCETLAMKTWSSGQGLQLLFSGSLQPCTLLQSRLHLSTCAVLSALASPAAMQLAS